MKKIAILIDGGHVRAIAKKKSGRRFDADFVEQLAGQCALATEEVQRILYYDCDPFVGRVPMPVTGDVRNFAASDQLTRDLSRKDLIAVRRGVLKFRGWVWSSQDLVDNS